MSNKRRKSSGTMLKFQTKTQIKGSKSPHRRTLSKNDPHQESEKYLSKSPFSQVRLNKGSSKKSISSRNSSKLGGYAEKTMKKVKIKNKKKDRVNPKAMPIMIK